MAALAGAEMSLRLLVAGLTGASTQLEVLRRRVQALRTAASLALARRAKAAGRWRAVFEAAPLPMAKVSADGRLDVVNSALCGLLGEPERALVGRRLSALVYPDDLPVLGGPGHPGRSAKGTAKAEVRLVCAGGRLRWCELASTLVRDVNGRAEYVLASFVDITQHKRSQAALRDLATRDPLSGLANRRWFELHLARHLRLCSEKGPRGAVLVVDLDNFKRVNDTLGHQAGDRLVLEVALSLRRHLRDADLVARLGGDEFAVVLHDGDSQAAEAVARKLVLAVREEVSLPATAASDLHGALATDRGPRPAPSASAPPSPAAAPGGLKRSPPSPASPQAAPQAGGAEAGEPLAVTVSVGVAPIAKLAALVSGRAAACPSGRGSAWGAAGSASAASWALAEPLGASASPASRTAEGHATSAGVLDFTVMTALSVAGVLRAADEAMYRAKRAGRDRYAVVGCEPITKQPAAGPNPGRGAATLGCTGS